MQTQANVVYKTTKNFKQNQSTSKMPTASEAVAAIENELDELLQEILQEEEQPVHGEGAPPGVRGPPRPTYGLVQCQFCTAWLKKSRAPAHEARMHQDELRRRQQRSVQNAFQQLNYDQEGAIREMQAAVQRRPQQVQRRPQQVQQPIGPVQAFWQRRQQQRALGGPDQAAFQRRPQQQAAPEVKPWRRWYE